MDFDALEARRALVAEHTSTEIKLRLRNKENVIMMGRSGAGKSTFLAHLLGHRLEVEEDLECDRTFIRVSESNDYASDVPRVGNTTNSETEFVHGYTTEDAYTLRRQPWVFVDSPGVGDTRGEHYEALSFMAERMVVDNASKIVALIVVVDMQRVGRRCEGIAELTSFMSRVIAADELNIFERSVAFVFTSTGRTTSDQIRRRISNHRRDMLSCGSAQSLERAQMCEAVLRSGCIVPFDATKPEDFQYREKLLEFISGSPGIAKQKLLLRPCESLTLPLDKVARDFLDRYKPSPAEISHQPTNELAETKGELLLKFRATFQLIKSLNAVFAFQEPSIKEFLQQFEHFMYRVVYRPVWL